MFNQCVVCLEDIPATWACVSDFNTMISAHCGCSEILSQAYKMEIYSTYEFEGGPIPVGFHCKGHVDTKVFEVAMRIQHNAIPLDGVRNTWARNIPMRDGGYYQSVDDKYANKRGSYKITECDWYEEWGWGNKIKEWLAKSEQGVVCGPVAAN